MFYSKIHCINPKEKFVKNEVYPNVYVEWITDPIKNCQDILPKLLEVLDGLTKLAHGGKQSLGKDFIYEQLKICKELLLIRSAHNYKIECFLRFDVYSDILLKPCGLAMYKNPSVKWSGIMNYLTLRILNNELRKRCAKLVHNPKTILVLRTDNPKLYQMRLNISRKVFPNFHVVRRKIDRALAKKINQNFRLKNWNEIDTLLNLRLILDNSKNIIHSHASLQASMPYISLNMEALKNAVKNHNEQVCYLDRMIRRIYSAHLPEVYAKCLRKIIKKVNNATTSHDYEIYLARDITPKVTKNENLEKAYDPIINDFYDYFLNNQKRDCLMIAFEINYRQIVKKLKEEGRKFFDKFQITG
jgi:hypothetical protein